MFHPDRISAQIAALERDGSVKSHGGKLLRYSVSDARAFAAGLSDAVDPKTYAFTRGLTPDEQAYIANELLMTQVDWRYWAERYVLIQKEGRDLAPMFPLWKSQEHILDVLGRLQVERVATGHPDGLLLDVLKARQLGASTMTQSIIAHRATTSPHTAGLIAADVPDQSLYLFSMLERTLTHAPKFLTPAEIYHPKTGPLVLSNGSYVRVESDKSMRGGLMEEGGQKGQMGVGKTFIVAHLSEVAQWQYPDQIQYGLLPALPMTRETFCVRESTAKGRGNYWHQQWKLAEAGKSRFAPVFIPWFIDPKKYWLPPPGSWTPKDVTVAYAQRAKAQSPRWLFGRSLSITRAQLYWYETNRDAAEAQEAVSPGVLPEFLANYPADPEESFQHTGRSVFSHTVLARLQAQSRAAVAAIEVLPATEISTIKADVHASR